MPTVKDAARFFQEWGQQIGPQKYRPGLLGDGQGHVAVANKPGWSWIRYDYRVHGLSIVRNPTNVNFPDGTPVLVGKRDPGDQYEQILFVAWEWYLNPSNATREAYANLNLHGITHAGKNNDPAPIDLNNLSPGKIVATDPASLTVTVYDFVYLNDCEIVHFGQADLDLSADRPGLYGHCYDIVYLDPSTGNLGSVTSDVVAADATPDYPTVPVGMIPLAIIDLGSWMGTITNDYIWQYKILYSSVCGDGVSIHTHSSDTEGGASLLDIEEFMVDCAEDILIQAGQIIPVQTYHRLIAPEGLYIEDGIVTAALHTIHADRCGQVIILKSPGSALYTDYRITLQHAVGNIWLKSESDLVLTRRDHVMLIYDGEYWCDL